MNEPSTEIMLSHYGWMLHDTEQPTSNVEKNGHAKRSQLLAAPQPNVGLLSRQIVEARTQGARHQNPQVAAKRNSSLVYLVKT